MIPIDAEELVCWLISDATTMVLRGGADHNLVVTPFLQVLNKIESMMNDGKFIGFPEEIDYKNIIKN